MAAVWKIEEPQIKMTQKALNPILDGKSICVLIIFLLAEIATTSDNVSMLPYNRSYYLRAPHLLRVGRSPTLPRIGRVPQCARFTHFGGWYVIRSITAPIFGRQVDTALFLASPAGGMNDDVVFRSDTPCKVRLRC